MESAWVDRPQRARVFARQPALPVLSLNLRPGIVRGALRQRLDQCLKRGVAVGIGRPERQRGSPFSQRGGVEAPKSAKKLFGCGSIRFVHLVIFAVALDDDQPVASSTCC